MADRIQRFFEKHRDERGDLEPPWARYPTLRHGSIGWRMGGGQSWLDTWSSFVADLDDAELLPYLHRHPPAPFSWERSLVGVLSGRRVPPEHAAELLVSALVRPDAAWPVYVRNELREGGVRAPWCWRHAKAPAATAKGSARDLSFWGRWCAAERAAGRLEAWLQAQPPAPEPWRTVVDALQRQVVPAEPHELWLACSLAAHGEPEPPWAQDAAPPMRAFRVRGDLERVDVWCRWVFWTFDDAPTWESTLQRRPPPAVWRAQVEDWFPWLHGQASVAVDERLP